MKAKDVMIPISGYLSPDATIEEAVNALISAKRGEERTGVKGLPVLDGKRRLIGMLTMRDILKAVFPTYMSFMNLGDFTWDGMLEEMARKVAARKVETVMTKDVMTVREEAPLMECVDHMIKGNIKRLPVVDESGGVVGMLYERDIFLAITKAMHQERGPGS
jgi:CBS-domain-containing membrane protein